MASKPRMRQWLEDLLDNNKCKGLTWVNRDERKFEITWHHASRQDFDTKEHADLFVQYAEFTGKTELVEETKKNYNSKLKSNFRSALHSLVDCVKVKDMTTGRSKGENAVRCYRFLDPSDPECKRRRTQKINSQRNSKKNGAAKSKCKIESEVKEETSVEYPFDEDNRILLPDEATEFFNNSNIQDEQNTSSIVCDGLVTVPMIDDIATPISYQATPTSCQALPPLPIYSSPEPSTSNTHSSGGADRNVFVVPGNEVVEIDLSALEGDNTATSSLPKFGILGVEDTFDSPISHASQFLKSGGSMRVKKEPKPKIPLPTYTELRNVELPQNQRSGIVEPGYAYDNTLETDPLLTVNVSNVMEQGSLTQNVQNIEESSFYRESDCNRGFNLGFGRIIQQNESVTVVLQDPQTISQGENYDLLDEVGQF